MGRSIIPAPGEGLQFIYIDDSSGGTLVQMKASVATYNDLPISGNTQNDLRIVRDTDRMYTWSIPATGGSLGDWTDIGQSISIDWSNVTNKPDVITSSQDGDYKKVTEIQYNPITEQIKFIYEE